MVLPNPPNNEDCVVAVPKRPPPVPSPRLGVVVPKILGVEVVVPNVEPNRGAGAEVVAVEPNKFDPVEAAGAPKSPVDVDAGVENKLGVVVGPPKRLGFVVAVEPKRFVPAEDAGAPNVEPA